MCQYLDKLGHTEVCWACVFTPWNFSRSVALKYLDCFWIEYSYAAQPCIFWKNLSGIKTTKFKPVLHKLCWAFSEPKESNIFIAGATFILARFYCTVRHLLRKPRKQTRDTNQNKTSSIWHSQNYNTKKRKVAEKSTSTKSCKTAAHAVMPVFWCSSFQGCQFGCCLSAYLS